MTTDTQAAIDWRTAIATPEAAKAFAASRGLMRGHPPSDAEVNAALAWMADVGIPAFLAMVAEAEQKGVSVYDLRNTGRD